MRHRHAAGTLWCRRTGRRAGVSSPGRDEFAPLPDQFRAPASGEIARAVSTRARNLPEPARFGSPLVAAEGVVGLIEGELFSGIRESPFEGPSTRVLENLTFRAKRQPHLPVPFFGGPARNVLFGEPLFFPTLPDNLPCSVQENSCSVSHVRIQQEVVGFLGFRHEKQCSTEVLQSQG